MIGLLRLIVVAVPATLWWGSRVLWAARRESPRLHCLCETVARRWARALLRSVGARVVLHNAEIIDPERPQVLVANHESWFDVLALAGYVPGRFRFVAKKELEGIPVFGPAWQACGHISIDRQDRARAIESLAVARQQLVDERPTVILFPEGTRSVTGQLRPFKKGAFVLAIQTGVDVVPAAIRGTRAIMRKGSWRIRAGGTIHVYFGEPIPVEGYRIEQRNELTGRARQAVLDLISAHP
jgi:1-acyl-sn-glycerol-3-phosphate acyltransferase